MPPGGGPRRHRPSRPRTTLDEEESTMQDYIVPELTEVGAFSDDTLGHNGHGWDHNHRFGWW
ncbi:hypothetical protein GCM10023222_49600 [Saccharopolyspora cebuensis]